jgi:hypothetical protein
LDTGTFSTPSCTRRPIRRGLRGCGGSCTVWIYSNHFLITGKTATACTGVSSSGTENWDRA